MGNKYLSKLLNLAVATPLMLLGCKALDGPQSTTLYENNVGTRNTHVIVERTDDWQLGDGLTKNVLYRATPQNSDWEFQFLYGADGNLKSVWYELPGGLGPIAIPGGQGQIAIDSEDGIQAAAAGQALRLSAQQDLRSGIQSLEAIPDPRPVEEPDSQALASLEELSQR